MLICDGSYAREIFKQANELKMMQEGFVWIVTDSITGKPSVLEMEGGYLPKYYIPW